MFRSRGGACTSAPETATGAFGPGRKRPVAPAVPEWNSALGLEFRASAPPKPVAATGGPILGSRFRCSPQKRAVGRRYGPIVGLGPRPTPSPGVDADRKSTRMNSSHVKISYAVLFLTKKI